MTRHARTTITTLACLLLLQATAAIGADYEGSVVLSGTDGGSDVHRTGVDISPDGAWVVYATDADGDGDLDVMSVRLDGSTGRPRQLIDTGLPDSPDGPAPQFHVTSDSSHVWFEDNVDGVSAVVSAPIDGSAAPRDITTAPGLEGISRVRVTPDGSRLVFFATDQATGIRSVYSTPVDGTGEVANLFPNPGDGDVTHVLLPPGTDLVVVRANPEGGQEHRLFSIPMDGSAPPTELFGEEAVIFLTFEPVVAPRVGRIVFHGVDRVEGGNALFSIDAEEPGSLTRLSNPGGGLFGPVHFEVAPDGRHVVFLESKPEGPIDLVSAPIDGSAAPTTLSTRGAAGDSVLGFVASETHVAYVGDLDVDDEYELYAARMGQAGSQRQLVDVSTPNADVDTRIRLAPRGAHVVFTADLLVDERFDLYSVPVDGGAIARLSPDPVPGGEVYLDWTRITPDGTRVTYLADLRRDNATELHATAVDGSSGTQVLTDLPEAGSGVSLQSHPAPYEVAPDGTFAVYRGDIRTPGRFELYATSRSAELAAPPPFEPVTATSVSGSSVTATWEPDADATEYEIEATPLSGARTAARSATAASSVSTLVPPTTVSATLDGLAPRTAYDVTVTARVTTGGSRQVGRHLVTTYPSDVVERVSGPDRYATAAAIARASFDPETTTTVYLATGRDFPDALAAGPLAARDGAPVLLTAPAELPESTIAVLGELQPDRVVALGGAAAVSEEVLVAAAALVDAETDRIGGATRYETAARIADALGGATDGALLATGDDFPDGLAGAALATKRGVPILLTTSQRLPEATRDALTGMAPEGRITALGGTAAVSDGVLADAASAAGGAATDRLDGPDRYATAAAVARAVGGGDSTAAVYLATGAAFPDALTVGAVAAAAGVPVVLVRADELPAPVGSALADLGAARVVVVGGTQAVTDRVLFDAAGASGL